MARVYSAAAANLPFSPTVAGQARVMSSAFAAIVNGPTPTNASSNSRRLYEARTTKACSSAILPSRNRQTSQYA